MAQQVEILSLNIDTQALLTKLSDTKKSIEQLQASQKTLQQAGQSSSQEFIQQAAQLKNLQTSYNNQFNVVTQLNAAKDKAMNVADSLNQALANEVQSIAQATENNKQLTVVRNQLNLATDEGQAALAVINEKLNENTEFIRNNVSAQEQQRMAIGDYSNQIKDALNNLNPFNGGITGFISRSKEAGGVAPLLSGSFAAIRTGMIGATQAGLAFIATPIGMVIAALAATVAIVVGAFKFMTTSMNSTEEGSQKLSKVMAGVSGIFNGFFKIVKPLGEWLGKVFIATLETVGEALDTITDGIASAMEFLGFDDAAKSVKDFKEEIKTASKASMDLAKAEGDLDIAQRKSKITQLEYQKQAEKLRQQRDDESKSIPERIALNKELGEVLKKQLADELKIAQKAVEVANLRIRSEGKTKDNLDKQAEAMAEIADIQERLTGQESEQLASQNGLRKEAADAEKSRQEKATAQRQKAVDDAIQTNKDEIALLIAQQGYKKKALQDELAFEEQISKKKLAILEKEYKAGKMTKEAYEAEKLNISNDYLKKQADATVSEAERELNHSRKLIEQKKADDSFFTQEKLAAKIAENNTLLQKELDFQLLRKDQGLINEQEYLDAIDALKEANRIKNEEAELQREEAKKAQKAIDIENQKILDDEKFTNDFEKQLADEDIRYQAELKAAEKSGADTSKIEQKHTNAKKKIEGEYMNARISAYGDMFGQIATLLGENTAAGKAAAIADATINAYLGISQVWAADSVLPEPAATIAKVASTAVVLASGLSAVKKITGVAVPSRATGGEIPKLGAGLINNGSNLMVPLSNGDDTLAYVGQGEVILNKEQQRRAGGDLFFRHLNVPGFANGGLVGGNADLGAMGGYKIDMDALAVKIGEQVGKANLLLPAPVTILDEITTAQSSSSRIREGANL